MEDPTAGIELIGPSHKAQVNNRPNFVTAAKRSPKSNASPIVNVNEIATYLTTAACFCDTGPPKLATQLLPRPTVVVRRNRGPGPPMNFKILQKPLQPMKPIKLLLSFCKITPDSLILITKHLV